MYMFEFPGGSMLREEGERQGVKMGKSGNRCKMGNWSTCIFDGEMAKTW